jgi:hypothetical protein
MKKMIQAMRERVFRKSKQEQLFEFVMSEKNLRKAVEGSMSKRVELIDRVDLKEKHA